jgi:glycosyltransferase involved in cell wall biosynthesis
MKILHVIENFDLQSGGPPPVVAGMCDALTAIGHDVSLYANLSPEPYKRPENVSYRLKLFEVDFTSFGVSIAMARALRDIRSFDLVHIHMLYRFPQFVAAYLARRAGVPYCVQPHGALVDYIYNHSTRKFSRRLYAQTVEKWNLVGAEALIFTAELERENAAALGFTGRSSYIVPVGAHITDLARRVDGTPFRQKYRIDGRKMLLWMGRQVPKKALDVLVTAFAEIRKVCPDTVLVIAGPDPEGYGAQVRAWVEQAGLADHVIFTGMISGEEKRQAFAAADIFVFPSYAENFGVVVLEAMAVGLPVVLSKGIDIWREIDEAGAASIVESTPEQVAAASIDLLQDPTKRARMGNAASRAAWNYDWAGIGRKLDSAYRDITR